MKQFLIYTTLAFLAASFPRLALSDLIKAFKSGDISFVTASLDNSVEITLSGQNESYSKSQATAMLSNFFSINRISDFKVLHQSESNETAYCIGNLITTGGTYRLTFFAKDKNGKTLLQEIRIEK